MHSRIRLTKNSCSDKWMPLEWFIPLYIVLQHYSLPVLNVGTIVLFVIVIIDHLNRHDYIIQIDRTFGYCLAYFIIHDLLKLVFISTQVSIMNTMIEYTFIVLIICNYRESINEDHLYHAWKIVSVFVYLGLIYHLIQISILGKAVEPIRILPNSFAQLVDRAASYRPSSVFTEPSAFVQFVFPLLFLSQKRKDFFGAVVSSLMLLASTSTTGVVVCAFLWGGYVLLGNMSNKKKAGIIIAIVFGIVLIFSLDIFSETFLKLKNTDWKDNFRIVRGWRLYLNADWLTQLLGIRYTTVSDYLKMEEVDASLLYGGFGEKMYFGYTSGITNAFILYGLFGGLLYANIYRKAFLDSDKVKKVFVVTAFAMIFAEPTVFGSGAFLVSMLMIYGIKQNRTNAVKKP